MVKLQLPQSWLAKLLQRYDTSLNSHLTPSRSLAWGGGGGIPWHLPRWHYWGSFKGSLAPASVKANFGTCVGQKIRSIFSQEVWWHSSGKLVEGVTGTGPDDTVLLARVILAGLWQWRWGALFVKVAAWSKGFTVNDTSEQRWFFAARVPW